MKLVAKINAFALAVMALLSLCLIIVGLLVIDDITYDMNRRLLCQELGGVADKVAGAHGLLERSGLAGVKAYVQLTEQEVVDELSDYAYGRTGRLEIFDLTANRLVLTVGAPGRINEAVFSQMAGQDAGVLEFEASDGTRFGAFRSFAPWNWLLSLSISRHEMFEKRNEFLQNVSAFALVAFVVAAFMFTLSVRALVGRLQRALDCVRKVEQGDFKARVEPVQGRDEIAGLQRGINSMVSRIEERTVESIRARVNLQASEKRYRGIFEGIPSGIFQTSFEGAFLSANPAVAKMLGFENPEEVIRHYKNLFTELYVHPEERKRFVEMLRDKGSVDHFETLLRRRDGDLIWVSLKARVLEDENGEPLCIEGTAEDVTARKKAELDLADLNRRLENLVEERTRDLAHKAGELRLANQRLKELDEAKSSFLSSVSHELRTPLTSILGFAKLINKDFSGAYLPLAGDDAKLARKGERIRDNLEIIEHEGERLTRLINDVLDLNKIESGRIEWHDVEMSMAECVEQAVNAVAGQFALKPDVVLKVEVREDLPLMRADRDRMVQVFINLLNNAAKFTKSGVVRLSVSEIDQGVIEARVSDTGVGINKEDLEKIFLKFQQAENEDTLAEKPKGTGLGLTICREIISHYGGRIWAESEPGKGSTFIFRLSTHPADRQGRRSELGAAMSEGSPVFVRTGTPLVLVVEDDQATSTFLTQLLGDHGLDVAVAYDGEQALEMAGRLRPDLITMDIMMPGMDGRTAIARLRGDPRLKDIPVLVLSVL
ncbi:MAG: ATP-binding protein, partial [Desulfovibrionaceae bacterium]|nr:ATP-binding protein [Desulfovibrionaceae bacterium]